MTFVLGYFIVKLEALIRGSNPIINTHTIYDYYNVNKNGLNLKKANQRFAIAFFDNESVRPMFDKDYVNLIAKLVTKDINGNSVNVYQQLHDCTEEDWAQFYPPDIDTQIYIKSRAMTYGVKEKDVRATFKCLEVND